MAATENVLDAPIAAMDFSRYFQLRAESVADLLRETDDELYDDGDDGCAIAPSSAAAARASPSTSDDARDSFFGGARGGARGAPPPPREGWGQSQPEPSEWDDAARMRVRGRAIVSSQLEIGATTGKEEEEEEEEEEELAPPDDALVQALVDAILRSEVAEELVPLVCKLKTI